MSSESAHDVSENSLTRHISNISSEEEEIVNDLSTTSDRIENSLNPPSSVVNRKQSKIIDLLKVTKVKSVLVLLTFVILTISSIVFALKGDQETSQKIFTLLTAQVIPALNATVFINCTNSVQSLLCQRGK
jgi:hypothetical protein